MELEEAARQYTIGHRMIPLLDVLEQHPEEWRSFCIKQIEAIVDREQKLESELMEDVERYMNVGDTMLAELAKKMHERDLKGILRDRFAWERSLLDAERLLYDRGVGDRTAILEAAIREHRKETRAASVPSKADTKLWEMVNE